MLRKIRITLATVFLIGLSLLFLDFTGTAHHWLAWMAKVQALEAVLALNVAVIVLLAIITVVFGRIYCSVICPLGIMQDIFGWLGKKAKKNRYSYSREVKWLRYAMLVIFCVAMIAGLSSLVQLLAPYSAFGRIMTMLFQPLWELGNNMLAKMAEHYESYAFYSVEVWMRSLPVLIIALVTLVVLGFLAWRNGRTYCNTICPVGTVLSFLSRFSLFKIRFDNEKCRNCSMCSKSCKASCIDFKNHQVDYSRCVVCGNCLESCHFGALSYKLSLPGKAAGAASASSTSSAASSSSAASAASTSSTSSAASASSTSSAASAASAASSSSTSSAASIDSGKRSFLLSSTLLATAALAQEKDKLFDGGYTDLEEKVEPERQTPLTPPGSLSAQNMALRCTGCQLCVSECPNGVLRPSSDLMHLMQPMMSYERGHCRPECTRCSEVCPAGAIKPIDKEEKTTIQIGHAVWIKKNCVPITDGVECGNCARHCPTGAIEMVALDENDDESPWVPAVNEAACIGCGACEYVCPARPFSAIYVEGHEVHKKI